ncbi:thiol:disulfide interchange protein precursor [archaeon BMS3Abin16]|nr:thiol:disulfide interchange protein precursor [archaeon BMS3Abin16]
MNQKKTSFIVSALLATLLVTLGWYVFRYQNLWMTLGADIIYRHKIGLSLAFLAGVASFFSPCSFPLLPGYMSYYLTMNEENTGGSSTLKRSVYLGFLAALGILLVYTVSGALLWVFGETVQDYLAALNPVVGVIIVLLGLALFTDRSFSLGPLGQLTGSLQTNGGNRASARAEKNVFLFGAGYGIAASGCTAPIFMGIVVASLPGGPSSVVSSVLFYSLGMGLLMVVSTVLVGLSKESLIKRMRTSTAAIKRASGAVLVVVGLALIYIYITSTSSMLGGM